MLEMKAMMENKGASKVKSMWEEKGLKLLIQMDPKD